MDDNNLPEQDDNNLPEQDDVVDPRDEIVNRARKKRDAENVEHADEITQLEELHGIKSQDDNDDNLPEQDDIIVNGEKSTIPVNDIIEAGKVALQMQKASEERFRDAARMRSEYERKLAELNVPEEDKVIPEEDNSDISEDDFVKTIMYGDDEDNIRKIYQKMQNTSTDNTDTDSKIDERIAASEQVKYQQRYDADRTAGNEAFTKDFPEINSPGNEWMHDIASGETQRLQTQYPNESPSRILHQAGLNTRQIVMNTIGIGAGQTVDDKTKLKQSLPKQTKQANVRRTSNTNTKPPTPGDIVNNIRGQRGQAEL